MSFRIERPILVAAASLVGCLLLSLPVKAQTTWTAGVGDWNNAANWDNGVPNSGTNPNRIVNGGHATISGNVPNFIQIRIGDIDSGANSSGTVTHSGGVNNMSSWIGVARGGQNVQGTFNMEGGTLNVNNGGRLYVAGENNIGGGVNTVGNFNMSGGTLNVSGQSRWGSGGAGGTANINISGGTLNVPQLYAGGQSSVANITHSGGTINASSWFTLRGDAGNDTFDMSGTASMTTGNEFTVGENGGGGTATLNITDSATLDVQNNYLAVGRNNGSVGEMNQDGLSNVRTVRLSLGLNGGTSVGTYNLDGGTLQSNLIGIDSAGSTFNWGDGTIQSYEVNTDSTIVFNGNLTTGYTADPNATSTLDLGNLSVSGSVIWDDLTVNGDLTLNSDSDVLDFWDSMSKLRPNSASGEITGAIELVNVTGTLSGQFDTVLGPGPDSRFFRLYDTGPTGVPNGTSADLLRRNTGYLDYRAGDGIYFVYKVSSAVPEPGTAGLLLVGVFLLKTLNLRRLARRS